MQKLLKLQHHRHSGKRLAHHHTSYRGLAAIFLASGIAMLMIQKAGAESYIVTAKVPVDIPAGTSEITAPPNNQIYGDPNITLSGTCPVSTPSVIVSLCNGGYMLGSQVCDLSGTFSIPITLQSGVSHIIPKTRTVLNDVMPDGAEWLASYNLPPNSPPNSGGGGTGNTSGAGATPSSTPTTTPSESAPSEPPGLFVTKPYITFTPNEATIIEITISPSASPYKLDIDWGDGTTEQKIYKDSGKYQLTHTYNKVANYTIHITLTDGNGKVTRIILAAISLAKNGLTANINPLKTIGGTSSSSPLIKAVWITYFGSLAVTSGFWAVQLAGQHSWAHALQHSKTPSKRSPRPRRKS